MLSAATNHNLPIQGMSQSIGEALTQLQLSIQNADQTRNEGLWLKTGFADFDEAFGGLRLAALTVLASRPSMGRSALALNIAANVGISQKSPVLYLSLDMPVWQLAMRMASHLAQMEVSALQEGRLTTDQDHKLGVAIDKAQNAPLHLIYCLYVGIDSVCEQVRMFALAQGSENALSLLVIDDLGYADLQVGGSRGDSDNLDAHENAMRLLKKLAVDLNVAILLLSPINPNAEGRENKRPVFTDLPSAAIARQADALLFLYRDEVYNPQTEDHDRAELIVASNRYGLTGTIYLSADLKYGYFGC